MEPPGRIRPVVDAALAQRGADAQVRRQAARAVVSAIFAHAGESRRRTFVEYAVWRLLDGPRPPGPADA
jgi:hypothetical protein